MKLFVVEHKVSLVSCFLFPFFFTEILALLTLPHKLHSSANQYNFSVAPGYDLVVSAPRFLQE